MLFDQNMIIDATRGSIARFVNHSCEPNCRMEKWTVGGKPRMALFAGERGIMTGDELTYDYNFDPFSQKNVQECRCGAKNCRGVLGPKAKEDKKPKDEASGSGSKSTLAGAKRKLAQIFDDSTSGLTKKRKITTSRSTTLIRTSSVRSKSLSPRKSINRRPSVLKRIVNSAKDKATQRRVVSASSASDALLPHSSARPLSRRESVKAKAENMRKNVVRSVRGGRAGKERSMRPIVDNEAE
jgi:[histone H3]-lysine4 N-trimethyltransferase ASH1L